MKIDHLNIRPNIISRSKVRASIEKYKIQKNPRVVYCIRFEEFIN